MTTNLPDQTKNQAENQKEIIINVEGDFKISDYIKDKTSDLSKPEFSEAITRRLLTLWLIKVYGLSLSVTILVGLIVPFVPTVDKTFFKEFTQNILSTQAPVITLVLGYYFGSQRNKDKDK